MPKTIQIDDKKIGDGHPLFIVAECGVTCNYDMKITKELVDVVKESGADAIKLLLNFPEEVMSGKDDIYEYDTVEGKKSENLFEMLDELRFNLDEWKEIKDYADNKGVVLFSTVSCPSAIHYARELNFELLKVSSWDYNYKWLWKTLAGLKRPVIMDTGPVNTFEIAKAVQWMNEENETDIILVHCFHTSNPKEMNMKSIPYLKTAFNCLTGYSARYFNDEMDYVAVALGAVFLEKRLTLSRSLPGHHQVLAKEPDEFIEYVKKMRDTHASLGVSKLNPSKGDIQERKRWFRHLVANKDIPAGTLMTSEMLEGKRPEAGISPEHAQFFGRTISQNIKKSLWLKFLNKILFTQI